MLKDDYNRIKKNICAHLEEEKYVPEFRFVGHFWYELKYVHGESVTRALNAYSKSGNPSLLTSKEKKRLSAIIPRELLPT